MQRQITRDNAPADYIVTSNKDRIKMSSVNNVIDFNAYRAAQPVEFWREAYALPEITQADWDSELWTDAYGTGGLYRVSSLGRVRRVGGGILQYQYAGSTVLYPRVVLSINGTQRRVYVHRLVWESFNGAIQPHMQIDHIDGNAWNARLSNLRKVTASENTRFSQERKRQLEAQHGASQGQYVVHGDFCACGALREYRRDEDGNLTRKYCPDCDRELYRRNREAVGDMCAMIKLIHTHRPVHDDIWPLAA